MKWANYTWEKYLQYIYVKTALFKRMYKELQQINNIQTSGSFTKQTQHLKQQVTKEDRGMPNKHRKGAYHHH